MKVGYLSLEPQINLRPGCEDIASYVKYFHTNLQLSNLGFVLLRLRSQKEDTKFCDQMLSLFL